MSDLVDLIGARDLDELVRRLMTAVSDAGDPPERWLRRCLLVETAVYEAFARGAASIVRGEGES